MSALASEHRLQPLPVEATRLLYERHSGRIFGYCLSLLGSREEAEDAVQTTFMNAQRGLDRGVVPQFELAWLFKIARNVCHNRHASASRRSRLESVSDLDALQDVLATPERGGSVSIGDLTGALGSIPERQRRALLLREFQGLSYGEIASDLGVSVAAVETLIFRGRRAVAEQLEQKDAAGLRGTLASVLALFGRFFGGGAGPLKLAAVTAGLATTATLAIVPAVRDHGAPAPVAPRVGSTSSPGSGVSIRRDGDRARPASRPVVKRDAPSKPAPPIAPPPVRSAAAPSSSSTAGQPSVREAKAAPLNLTDLEISVPAVSVPPITVPPITVPPITVPEVSLPSVELPQLETPSLPDLPKLP